MSIDGLQIDIEEAFQLLFHPHNPTAYKALQALENTSAASDQVYSYLDRFAQMLDSGNSYIRTRGLSLIAHNARWDTDNRIDGLIDSYLRHITDPKPITARQCIKLLPMLAKYKPELREDILSALLKADTSIYKDSMQPLVSKDIACAVADIRTLQQKQI